MRSMCAVIAAGAVTLAGCTSTGTSFGLPRNLLDGPVYGDATVAVTNLTARNNEYLKAAQGAANGSQLFDVPIILAGIAAVAASAIEHVPADLRGGAGTVAAGGFGFRTYYNSGSRFGAYVGGARSTSCLLKIATDLEHAGLDKQTVAAWQAVKYATDGNASPDMSVLNIAANSVVSAPKRLSSAAVRTDTEVIRKLKSPDAPDLPSYMKRYEEATRQGKSEEQSLTSASFVASDSTKLALVHASTPSTKILDALVGLDAKIEECIAYAA